METIVAAISSAGRGEIYGDYGDTAQATRLRQVNISDNVVVVEWKFSPRRKIRQLPSVNETFYLPG